MSQIQSIARASKSDSFKKLNPDFFNYAASRREKRALTHLDPPPVNPLVREFVACSLMLTGPIKGGKNNMVVTRTGHHFPTKDWARWRDKMVATIKMQLPPDWQPITIPVTMRLDYYAADHRRHDQPAILDSIFHVLEKSGVVADDCLIWCNEGSRQYDKAEPRTIVVLRKI